MATRGCPCGYYTDRSRACVCTPWQIQKYRSKVSGPLMDRIDLHVEVPAVPFRELHRPEPGEGTAAIRERVLAARQRQQERYRGERLTHNAQLQPRQIRRYCEVDAAGKRLLERAMARLGLSARAYHRILKVARTIADLAARDSILPQDLAEAIQYRSLDRGAPSESTLLG